MQGFVAASARDSRVSNPGAVCMLAGMRIGERIRHARTGYRLAKGLEVMTQDQVADAAGMERGKLSLIELGTTKNVKEADIKVLAGALGVSPCWLALGVGEIEITQLRGSRALDDALLQSILEVVLEVVVTKGLRTSPSRLSKFVVKRYKEEVEQGSAVDRREIEKILEYFD